MKDRPYGGFWRRLLAYCIDWIILYLISLILLVIGLIALRLGGVPFADILTTGGLSRRTGLFLPVYAIMSVFTGMAYFTWFHGAGGQTPGKMLSGLRVIQATGDAMTFGIAFLRWTGSLVSGLVLCLGYIWIAFDQRKQGWHDKIAATLVIRVGNKPGAEPPAPLRSESTDYTLTEDAPFPVVPERRPEAVADTTETPLPAHNPCSHAPYIGDGAPGASSFPPGEDAPVSSRTRNEEL